MKRRKCSVSSEDSNEPLAKMKHNSSRNALFDHNWEQCEFCDSLFSNRYSIMKHNATHIIIPLIKLKTHQCDECLHHFTSLEDLATHMSGKHKDVLPKVTSRPVNPEDKVREKLPEILQSIVTKQVIVKCNDELKEVFIKGNELKLKNEIMNGIIKYDKLESLEETPKIGDVNGEWHEDIVQTKPLKKKPINKQSNETLQIEGNVNRVLNEDIVIDEPLTLKTPANKQLNETLKMEGNINTMLYEDIVKEEPLIPKHPMKERTSSLSEQDKESLRNRLLFEEDLEDTLLKDLSVNCQVSIEMLCQELDFNEPLLETMTSLQTDMLALDDSSVEIIYDIDKDKVQEETTNLIQYGKAIHYDVLNVPEVCRCRWCEKDFPNRYKMLQHESEHLRLKRKIMRPPLCVYCDKYIAGNYISLRVHIENKHPLVEGSRNYNTFKCPKCHLRYRNYVKHVRNYHEIYVCQVCGLRYETAQLRDDHECVKLVSADATFNDDEYSNENYQQRHERLTKSLSSNGDSIMLLCDMCYSFMKVYMEKRRLNYDFVGTQSQVGVQQTCEKCNSRVFEVKVVRRKRLKHTYEHTHNHLHQNTHKRAYQHTHKNARAECIVKEIPKPKRYITNEIRLKNIQNRLKMLKMLNKC